MHLEGQAARPLRGPMPEARSRPLRRALCEPRSQEPEGAAMPWHAEYLSDGAHLRFSGRTTGDELIQANTEFYAHAYEPRLRFALFDFSAADTVDIDNEAIQHVVLQDRAAAARDV